VTFLPSAAGFHELGQRLADRLRTWASAVEATARELAPVETGALREGMFVLVYLDGQRIYGDGPAPADVIGSGVEVFIGNAAGYGRWVHDGTSDTSPQPFLQQALAAHAGMLA
jgi:hypothetical protein